jgi:hypothetical protein
MTTVNRTRQQNADQKLIDGLTKHRATITSLPIGGKTLTPDEVVQTLQARVKASATSLTSKASAKAAVLAERADRAETRQFVSDLTQVIRSMFGGSADVLADFGLALRKPRKSDPQKKVAAAQKAKATRTLRHTMGKKQKAAIKATGPLAAGATPPAANAHAAPAASAEAPATAPAPAATPPAATAPAAPPAVAPATHARRARVDKHRKSRLPSAAAIRGRTCCRVAQRRGGRLRANQVARLLGPAR